MDIEIKKSIKPVNYYNAINFMEVRLQQILEKKKKNLIWALEHNEIFTGGTSYSEDQIIDKSIKVIKTNRGGKITCHGPGQLVFYFVIDLRNKRNVRELITTIEKTIIDTLISYDINTFADKNNIGIWYDNKKEVKKVAAIGLKIKKWIAYHGFSINIQNNLEQYKKIIPCGIFDKGVTNLKMILNQDYSNLHEKIIENFILNLQN